jgi:hypothetical protein
VVGNIIRKCDYYCLCYHYCCHTTALLQLTYFGLAVILLYTTLALLVEAGQDVLGQGLPLEI